MKAHPSTNYPVRILPPWGDADRQSDPAFEGVFEVQINHDVRVLFVEDLDRAADVLVGERVIVTADQHAEAELGDAIVVRIDASRFSQFVAQLTELCAGPAGVRGGAPIASMASTPVIRFLQSSVLIPRHLRPYEQQLLGLSQAS